MGQFLGCAGVGKDGGVGARPAFVAVTMGSSTPEKDVHYCEISYVAAVTQNRVAILMSALNWACHQPVEAQAKSGALSPGGVPADGGGFRPDSPS